MTAGRPLPLHGAVEEDVVDFELWKRRRGTAMELLAITERLAQDASTLAETQALIGTLIGAADGYHSDKAQRRWRALRRRQGQVVPFRARREQDGPHAA